MMISLSKGRSADAVGHVNGTDTHRKSAGVVIYGAYVATDPVPPGKQIFPTSSHMPNVAPPLRGHTREGPRHAEPEGHPT